VQREFWQYTSSSNTFKVKVSANYPDNVYTLGSSPYIHQGSTKLTMSQLANGDKITIYVWKNKVVEIEK
jgi:TPP-dependent indolepyruvate ferredoxin oxidoreductase alpha subunit